MAWINPQKPEEGMAPLPQHIQIQEFSTEPALVTPLRIRADVYTLLEEILATWGTSGVTRLSGALAIDLITKTFPRYHSNCDKLVVASKGEFYHVIQQAQRKGMYLFERTRRWKLWPKSNIYHETFIHVNADTLYDDQKTDRNPMLCTIDGKGGVSHRNTAHDRWRLYLYEEREGNLYCKEDNTQIPSVYAQGPVVYTNKQGHQIKAVHPRMLLELQEKMMQKSKHQKHRVDYERLKNWLNNQKEW